MSSLSFELPKRSLLHAFFFFFEVVEADLHSSQRASCFCSTSERPEKDRIRSGRQDRPLTSRSLERLFMEEDVSSYLSLSHAARLLIHAEEIGKDGGKLERKEGGRRPFVSTFPLFPCSTLSSRRPGFIFAELLLVVNVTRC